ncbi:DegV family protein [Peribacillus frigoritolerans]|uniref:DegV family protein n=1 Tax=Peribacillus frigoritolerans TaxID=450367 RepID=UPI00105A19CC|nr:DegV family protein [Peribacillus frigoritolerans]TDL82671.1 DegV family protein [Peribacillus frigoritolerans]
MRRKIAWVTDSTASIDAEMKDHPDVYWVPMVICINDEEYLDGVNLQADDLYALLKDSSNAITTSQPPPGAFVELYTELAEKYDEIVSIHLSSLLSGTYTSAVQAAAEVDIPVTVVDSLTLSEPLTRLVKAAIKMHESGLAPDEIAAKLETLRENHRTYVLIGDLTRLHKSGRMSGTQYYLGSLLNIQPIIRVESGKLSTAEKVRSEKKAFQYIINLIKKGNQNHGIHEIAVLFSSKLDKSSKLYEVLQKEFPDIHIKLVPLCTTIGVHTGEDVVGVTWFEE